MRQVFSALEILSAYGELYDKHQHGLAFSATISSLHFPSSYTVLEDLIYPICYVNTTSIE